MGDSPEWSPVNIERGQIHSILARAVQECLAQNIHLLPALGDYRGEGDVRSKQSWFGVPQVYHGDLADDVPQWSQSRINQESNFDYKQMTPHDILCESEMVSRNFKRDQGCTPEQITPPCKTCNPLEAIDTLGVGEGKKWFPSDYIYDPQQNTSQYVYDNEPKRDNTAWEKWQNYKINGDAVMLAEIQADELADKYRQLREQGKSR